MKSSNSTPCTAVIMAGGFGTRLKPLTVSLPKPMVPMGNRPLMEYVVDLLAKHGHTSIMTMLYYHPDAITEHFGNGTDRGLEIRYLRPDADFGTAGSVRHALPQLAERFVVLSADVLTNIDLAEAVAFHERSGAEATMVLTRRENPLAFGIVVTDESGRIQRFLEKPSWGEVFSDTINTGIYVLERSVLESWPDEHFLDFGKDVFPRLLEKGRKLYGYVSPGYWRDVGTVNEYAAANHDLIERVLDVRWQYPERIAGGATVVADPSSVIADDVVFEGTVVLGRRVSLGSGACIANSVIGPGSVVGSGARIRRSVLWSAVTVGPEATLDEAIVQTGARIGRRATLREGTIVAELCHLEADVTVNANCRIWPRKRVEEGATVSSSIVWGEQYNRELFTDAKVSGLTNREFTPEFAARLGAAFSSQFKTAESIVLARDQSIEARAVAEALKSGIASSGVNIRDLRDTIVPVLRYELTQGRGCAGIYVRRTPDEPLSTDAIFFDAHGFDLAAGKAQSVERLFLNEDFRRADPAEMGVIEYPEGTVDRYRNAILRHVDVEAIASWGFRIVVDYRGGFAETVLPSILTQLGVETISLNSQLQRVLANDAARERGALARIVNAVGYDFGISISAPGERIDLVDRQGTVLPPQQLLLVMARLFWRIRPGTTIAAPVVATSRLEVLAEAANGTVVRVKNDHQSMMQAAVLDSVDFVCGTQGGFILPPDQRGADAIASTVRLLEWLAQVEIDLTAIAAESLTGVMAQADVACPWNLKGRMMRRLAQETGDLTRQLIDGVRLDYDDGWIWIAPDRRTAHFNLLAESEQPWRAESMINEWRERLQDWVREEESAQIPAASGRGVT